MIKRSEKTISRWKAALIIRLLISDKLGQGKLYAIGLSGRIIELASRCCFTAWRCNGVAINEVAIKCFAIVQRSGARRSHL
jgi:hypothetical protein